jgi:hypothetical protein
VRFDPRHHLALGLLVGLCALSAQAAHVRWELGLSTPPAAADDMAQRLVRWAETSTTPAEAVERHLAAANWILGPQMAAIATRYVLGEPAPDDLDQARRLVTAARLELAAAEAALEGLKPAPGEEDKEGDPAIRKAQRDLATLRAFGNAFACLWPEPPASEEDLQAKRTDAALELSEPLEDARAEVAQAAVLWQACLYESAGRLQRALDGLPPILSTPSSKSPFGFYARLLHYRFAAQSESSPSALAAVMARLEHRGVDWVEEGNPERARKTVAYLRRGLLVEWAEKLRAAGQAQRAEWCDEQVASIDRTHFAESGPAALLALPGAAPTVVSLDKLDARIEGRIAPQPSPTPAGSPTPAPSPAATPAADTDTSGFLDDDPDAPAEAP